MLAEARSKPNGADVWLGVAQAALQNGDPERCKVLLTSWLEQDPHNVAFNVLLSKALQQAGTPEALEKSVSAARSAVKAATGADGFTATVQLAVALGARARVHVRQQLDRQKDRAEAVQLLNTLLDSGAAAAAGAGPVALAAARYSLAVLQAEAGQAAAAMGAARAALQDAQAASGAGAAGAPAVTALCLVLVSVLLSSRRQFKLAASVLTAAPTTASLSKPTAPSRPLWSDCLVLRLRSRLLAAQDEPTAAIAALAQAKKLLAGWATAAGGGTAASNGVPAGANLDRLNAELAKVWGELGAALARAGQRPEAMAAVDHALALAPWSAASRTALGVVYETLGGAGAAEVAYNDALALDPTHAAALLRQGSLHARRGSRPDLAVARDLLAEALRYEPAAAAGWYGLGRVAAALGHGSEAEAHLLTAVQLAGAAPLLPYAELPLAPP
ncbi:hypothetical protein HYH02_009268 [Chlamydomonas schloesseri]|uniref:Uncharacterized protein n=1 Tax=Chlamydomonas schloesseri TaxID=2026947 RepID=A0A835TFK8_9CHLO|nr:hypothetical protein HYH02_009268 [Chlamydomonas schloesseri]|eukprot:KAG2443191.1 hypothetical protein HYH02_009268 [Chlamydomonas schloesseri]